MSFILKQTLLNNSARASPSPSLRIGQRNYMNSSTGSTSSSVGSNSNNNNEVNNNNNGGNGIPNNDNDSCIVDSGSSQSNSTNSSLDYSTLVVDIQQQNKDIHANQLSNSAALMFSIDSLILDDYAIQDHINNNNNNNDNDDGEVDIDYQEPNNLNISKLEQMAQRKDTHDSFSLEEPVINFLSNDHSATSSLGSNISYNTQRNNINRNWNRARTDSLDNDNYTDYYPNYHEIHQDIILLLSKDKIIIRPHFKSKEQHTTDQSPDINQTQHEHIVIDRNTLEITVCNDNIVTNSNDVNNNNINTNNQSSNNNNNSSSNEQNENNQHQHQHQTNKENQNSINNYLTANFIIGHGIVGIINLISGPYLIVITERKMIGSIRGKAIYEIDECQLISISTSKELSDNEKRLEQTYKKSIKALLGSDFYFSYELDLSNSLQRTSVLNQYDKVNHLYQKFEDRFFWNKFLQTTFIEKKLNSWILPVIRGHVEIYNFFIDQYSFEFALISRRSRFRAGTRYNTRGSDQHGNVANYVETEQILHCNSATNINYLKTFSLIQIRGSIPLLWEQSGYKIKPIIKINQDQNLNMNVFKAHFNQQVLNYGPQTIVTLLDQKGSEEELNTQYKSTLEESIELKESVNLVAFDFHHYCQGNRFDRVDILIEKLENTIEKIGYLERDPTGYQSYQNGSIRTNCLDCLDRTNLVQSMIGLRVLELQFQKVGIEWNSKDSTNNTILKQIKLSWANNGDAVSQQYAGTSALKGDFTRTGKRNTKGVFKDGVNSLTRYYINTFLDKIRQMSIDMFLGINTIETHNQKIMENQKDVDWGESRSLAINTCVDHFLQCEKEGQMGFINAWIVISINKRNQEQERIFLLTPTHMVRCKYNFNENKIVHYKQVHVSTLRKIQKGYITTGDGKKISYGMRIYYENNKSKVQKKSSAPKAIVNSHSLSSSGNNLPLSTSPNSSPSTPPTSSTTTSTNNSGTNSPTLSSSINFDSLQSMASSPPKHSTVQIDMNELKDLSYQTYILPIPEGENIDFGRDLVAEMAETIKECVSNVLGYSNTNNFNNITMGQTFIFEKDFKRKTNTFSAAYNGLKLGFYSKSPTIGSGGKLNSRNHSNGSFSEMRDETLG